MTTYSGITSGANLSQIVGLDDTQDEAIRTLEKGATEPSVKPDGLLHQSTDTVLITAAGLPGVSTGLLRWDQSGSQWVGVADLSQKQINAGGTVAFGADQSMGGNKITNVAAGTAAADGIRRDQALLRDGSQAKPLEKSAKLYKGEIDLNGFDIEAEIKKNPDHLFVKVLAIKKDEVNENGDSFPEKELKKSAETFIGVPVFCNHQNDNIENARGKVVHAWYDDDADGVYTINMVDAVAYPSLARGIEEGYIIGTSMGCSVEASVCSVCGNVAETADHYCDHVKNQKNRTFSGKTKFAYGENGNKTKGLRRVSY